MKKSKLFLLREIFKSSSCTKRYIFSSRDFMFKSQMRTDSSFEASLLNPIFLLKIHAFPYEIASNAAIEKPSE